MPPRWYPSAPLRKLTMTSAGGSRQCPPSQLIELTRRRPRVEQQQIGSYLIIRQGSRNDDSYSCRRGGGHGLPRRTRLPHAAVVAAGASVSALNPSSADSMVVPPLRFVLFAAPSGRGSSPRRMGASTVSHASPVRSSATSRLTRATPVWLRCHRQGPHHWNWRSPPQPSAATGVAHLKRRWARTPHIAVSIPHHPR